MPNLYLSLLRQYSDALLEHQFVNDNPEFFGGMFCDSCKVIHGRCIDAIYGLVVAYKEFKDEKYLLGAKRLLAYSHNLICKDGGIYNDLQTTWRYTTTFFVIDIAETLFAAKDILPNDFVKDLENHLSIHAKWLYEKLDEKSPTNINYPINNCLALFLAGTYLKEEKYLKQSKHLANYALEHISENNLLFGEGRPHNKVTPNGCLAIDLGYNLEESLPALAKYAYYSKNKEMLDTLYKVAKAHLDFILPDGAIDNSFGCRNYKWTYYGSRTCDGIFPLALIYGERDSRFLEAARRNLLLLKECSPNGLLSGGPDYAKHNEKACLHHTFEHINAIAFGVVNFSDEYLSSKGDNLPSDGSYEKYYKEFASYRLANKNYLMDISCYDENIPYNGHASGATATMLFSRKEGPIIMGSVGNYCLTEATNMQVPLDTESHRPLLPRFEIIKNGKLFSSAYFLRSKKAEGSAFKFISGLGSKDGEELEDISFSYEYLFSNSGLTIKISNFSMQIPFILPLINGELSVEKGKIISERSIFFLTPGFLAKEFKIQLIEGEAIIHIK